MKYGIDALTLYVPKLALALQADWAQARASIFAQGNPELLCQKVEKGIGITHMSIPDYHEDSATMAAMAIKNLMEENEIKPSQIGYLAVATETGLDHSKNMGTYIMGMLEAYFEESFSHVGSAEYKFACIGSTYALESSLALLESKRLSAPYAIVVCSDIAKYQLESSAEYTQGAGAIALLLSENPRLVEIDAGPMGTHSVNAADFYRPLNKEVPVVDGKHSMQIYEQCTFEAYQNLLAHRKQTTRDFDLLNGPIDYCLFHLPFPKMAKHAATFLLKNKELPTSEERKAYSQTEEFQNFLNRKINPSLELAPYIGNIYTGSLYLSLLSLLSSSENCVNKKALFFAYGSGASAKVFSGTIKSNLPLKTKEKLLQRRFLSLTEYEDRHKQLNDQFIPSEQNPSIVPPQNEFIYLGYDQMGPKQGFRKYSYKKES